MVRWPGQIKPGEVSNEMFSGLDWFPTLLAAAGDTTVKDRLLKGATVGGKTLQGPSRRLQPAGLPHRARAEERAQRVLLLQRRRRSGRERGSDDWKVVCGAARAGRLRSLEQPVHSPASAEDLQPAHGPLRAGRHRLGPVLRLDQPKNAYLSRDGVDEGGGVSRDLRRVSAEPAPGELQRRSDLKDVERRSEEKMRKERAR